jgi:hypothetical protein
LGKEFATTKVDDIVATFIGKGQTKDFRKLFSSSQESHLCFCCNGTHKTQFASQ